MYFIEAGNRELTNLGPAINQPCLGESVLPTIKVSVWSYDQDPIFVNVSL